MTGPTAAPSGYATAGIALVLLTALVSGVSTFVNAYAIRGTGSDDFVTVRNLAVAAALVPLAVLGSRSLRSPLRAVDWARLAAIGIVGGGVPFLLFFHGLALATAAGGAATASFGYRTLFLLATVLGVVVLRERFHLRTALAAACLLAGNALLLALTAPIWTDGTAFVMAATGLWAVEYTISKRALRDLPSGTVALGRMGFGAAVLVGYVAATSQLGAVASFSAAEWAWVGVSAALLLAFVATWYAGLARVDLGTATSVLVLGFPITWLLAVAVRGSSFTLAQAAGAALVTVGVVLAVGWVALRAVGRDLLRPRPATAPAP